MKEIKAAMSEVQLGLFNEQQQVIAQWPMPAARTSIDNSNDEAYDRKTVLRSRSGPPKGCARPVI